jgi:AdoMet-dependent heme synthase
LQSELRALPGRGQPGPSPRGTGYGECLQILDQIEQVGKPIVILTGGEPLLREDVFELARYGTDKGLRMVMATNGTLITKEVTEEDEVLRHPAREHLPGRGRTPSSTTGFRKVPGAFEGALRVSSFSRRKDRVSDQHDHHQAQCGAGGRDASLGCGLGAAAHHIFLLVPTGRAKDMTDQEIDAGEYEKLLHWFYAMRRRCLFT